MSDINKFVDDVKYEGITKEERMNIIELIAESVLIIDKVKIDEFIEERKKFEIDDSSDFVKESLYDALMFLIGYPESTYYEIIDTIRKQIGYYGQYEVFIVEDGKVYVMATGTLDQEEYAVIMVDKYVNNIRENSYIVIYETNSDIVIREVSLSNSKICSELKLSKNNYNYSRVKELVNYFSYKSGVYVNEI